MFFNIFFKCETDDETKAVIRMAEEYVGDDG
jgi:hypothetical protein